jgi:hypothetical protein
LCKSDTIDPDKANQVGGHRPQALLRVATKAKIQNLSSRSSYSIWEYAMKIRATIEKRSMQNSELFTSDVSALRLSSESLKP